MSLEEFEKAWRSQKHGQLGDTASLLDLVRREDRKFRASIFWRDLREVGVCLILIPVWIYLGGKDNLPWSWYLGIPAMIWVAGFLIVDKARHKRNQVTADSTLREYLDGALTELDHQIWLLRNVFWWYLLPFALAANAFFFHTAWGFRSKGFLAAALPFAFGLAVTSLIFWGVYWLNQYAVRKDLQPRRRRLEELYAQLDGE